MQVLHAYVVLLLRTAHVRVGCQNLEKQQQQQQQITTHQFFQNVSNTIVGLVCKLGLLYSREIIIYIIVCVFAVFSLV